MFALILAENSRFRENGPPKLHLTTNLAKCSYHLPIPKRALNSQHMQ